LAVRQIDSQWPKGLLANQRNQFFRPHTDNSTTRC
jgi:hypothetical protein